MHKTRAIVVWGPMGTKLENGLFRRGAPLLGPGFASSSPRGLLVYRRVWSRPKERADFLVFGTKKLTKKKKLRSFQWGRGGRENVVVVGGGSNVVFSHSILGPI